MSVIYEQKSEKHHISLFSHADVRRKISTKFCMIIEVVRAIISSQLRRVHWDRPDL